MIRRLLRLLKGSIFHPQWMTDRFHLKSKQCLLGLRNSVVLDIGSGDAGYQELIHSSNSLYTIDYPSTNQNYQTVPQVFSDARCLPVANAKADVFLLFEVLEHIAETEKVVNEIQRVLKSGGALYLSVPFIYPIHDAPGDYWRFTVYGVTEILEKNGFDIVSTIAHGNTLTAAMQMFNLGLLELCRDLGGRNMGFGLLAGLLVYPVTFIVNLLAWPLFYLPLGNAGNFGYFLVARKKDSQTHAG